jgi:two-component system nitrogen regulation response regulator NtrX
MKPKPEVLIVDDDRKIVDSLSLLYKDNGYIVTGALTGNTAAELASGDRFDLIILDIGLPDIDGVEVLKILKAQKITAPVIIVSGQATIKDAVEATRLGAFNIIEKPPDPEKLLLDSRIAIKQRSMERELNDLRRSLLSQNDLVGQSEVMRSLKEKLRRVAETDSRVYILGEPGAGKEMAARFIHFSSPRMTGPFIAVNCAAIPGELFESELFGHERGAFTGAVERQIGKLESADGGTLFLDEVGELNPQHQAKLLRAIETSAIQRLGSSRDLKIDVRIMAASNKDLQKLTREGRFREDLYFRLNVIPVYVPPLRDRLDDIPLFVRHFLDALGYGRLRIEPGGMTCLKGHHWPGNVRELRNIIERTAALCYGDTITAQDISDALADMQGGRDFTRQAPVPKTLSLREHMTRYERSLLQDILLDCDGNITKAAKMLKMDRGNLSKKLKSYGLKGK